MKTSLDGIDVLIGTNGRSNVYCNLDNSPHLFIESQPGYGKSVMLRSILNDLAANYSSDELEVYVSDMKLVEANQIFANHRYSDIVVPLRHTLEAESIISWLDQIYDILEQRSRIFEDAGCKNIREYKEHHSMSRIVVIFDELGAALRDNFTIEEHIVIGWRLEKILKLSRFAGMHVIATSNSAASLTPIMAKLFSHYVQLNATGLAAFEGRIVAVPINAS